MSSFKRYTDYKTALQPLMENLPALLAEAKGVEELMFDVGSRCTDNCWTFAAMQLELEDRGEELVSLSKSFKELCPITTKLCEGIKDVEAFGFSKIRAKGRITPHMHNNAFVSCIINLQSNDETYIVSDGETKELKEGEVVIFDYRPIHEIINNGNTDRISLLVLLPIKQEV